MLYMLHDASGAEHVDHGSALGALVVTGAPTTLV
jgi:hypothetical protein